MSGLLLCFISLLFRFPSPKKIVGYLGYHFSGLQIELRSSTQNDQGQVLTTKISERDLIWREGHADVINRVKMRSSGWVLTQ